MSEIEVNNVLMNGLTSVPLRSVLSSTASARLDVTADAYNLLRAEMEKSEYGNVLSPAHAATLQHLLHRYTALADGTEDRGRWAIALPTATGKSLSIACWCATVYKHGLPWSVLISAARVEELCKMKRRLIALGVEESAIGLWYDSRNITASEPASTGDHRAAQFLLITHTRIQHSKDLDEFNRDPEGNPRSIVFHDESLLIARSRHLSVQQMATYGVHLAGQVERYVEGFATDDADVALAERFSKYISQATQDLRQELDRQKSAATPDERAPHEFHFEALRAEEMSLLRSTLGKLMAMPQTQKDKKRWGIDNHLIGKQVRLFLEMSQSPVRVLRNIGSQGGGDVFCQYQLIVSPELDRMVVLDGSFPIRELCRLPGSSVEELPAFRWDIKKFSRCDLRVLNLGSGRRSTRSDFSGDQILLREIVNLVTNVIADQEPILIYVHKPQSRTDVNIPAIISQALTEAGVDVAPLQRAAADDDDKFIADVEKKFALVKFMQKGLVSVEPGHRVHIETLGRETGLNEYSMCRHVVAAGLLFPPEDVMAGQALGEQDNLRGDATRETLNRVVLGEAAHSCYQLFSRGTSRRTVNGEAGAQTMWLVVSPMYSNKLVELLETIMPGIKIGDPWPSIAIPKKDTGRSVEDERVIEAMVAALKFFSDDVGFGKWKAKATHVFGRKITKREWQRLRAVAAKRAGWILTEQSAHAPDSAGDQGEPQQRDGHEPEPGQGA